MGIYKERGIAAFFWSKIHALKYKYLIFSLLQNQVWRRPATGLALSQNWHCFAVPPRSGHWVRTVTVSSSRHRAALSQDCHRPAAVNYLTLSVMPALIVSGARSKTALSSPAISMKLWVNRMFITRSPTGILVNATLRSICPQDA